MAQEREIKLRIEDLPGLRRALAKIGARIVRSRLHEGNTLFDTPQFDLAKSEQLLRIRTESSRSGSRRRRAGKSHSVVTFKRPAQAVRTSGKGQRHKVRDEVELEVSDPRALAKIFEGLGMPGWFRYEKFRTTFQLSRTQRWAKGLLLELDETPIGIFLELEGPASAIDRAARALGFRKSDYVVANYMDLHREYCRSRGVEPGDMLFGKKQRRPRSLKTKNIS
jgi:adenylate cyclase, class 2